MGLDNITENQKTEIANTGGIVIEEVGVKEQLRDFFSNLLTNKNTLKVVLISAGAVIAFISLFVVIYIITRPDFNEPFDDGLNDLPEIKATSTPFPTLASDLIYDNSDTDESELELERRVLLALESEGKLRFSDMLAINPDFLGYIEIPGVLGPLPYVFPHDNEEYLYKDFIGEESDTGAIYMNMNNDRLLIDNNTLLSGFYTDLKSVYTRLLRYKEANTLVNSPVIVLDCLIGEITYVIFSVHMSERDERWTTVYNYSDDFAGYLEELRARSIFDTNVDVTAGDRIITLSVCDYTYEDMRFFIHARRLRSGESLPESISVKPNVSALPYNIPLLNPLDDLELQGSAFAVDPTSDRYFFFRTADGEIERYSGNTDEVQGPFTSLADEDITEDNFISAYIIEPEGRNNKGLYVAVQNAGGTPGITVYTSGSPFGPLYNEGVVTPEDVNARYPAVIYSGGTIRLLYSVPADDNSSEIYIQNILGGKAEYLYTVRGVTNARPLGLYTVNGQDILVWHEPADRRIYGRRLGADGVVYDELLFDEIFRISGVDANVRILFFGLPDNNRINAFIENDGKLTFTTFDLSVTPDTLPWYLDPDYIPPDEEDDGHEAEDDDDDGDDDDDKGNGDDIGDGDEGEGDSGSGEEEGDGE